MIDKKKQKCILTKGLVCSGKSTWAREFIKQNQTYKRVNRDYLRYSLSDYTFNNENENLVTKIEKVAIKEVLDAGYNLIIDETHLNPKILEKNIRMIKEIAPDIEIEIKEFHVSLEEAIVRDKVRGLTGGLGVGEKVIRRMYFQYIYKEHQENLIPYNKNLPDAIICDIDGTLSLKGSRNPFDYSKVKEDKPNIPIINLIEIIDCASTDLDFFIFSGRENKEDCYKDTKEWLDKYDIMYKELHLRKEGDMRKDSIVKKEIYEEHVKGKYNVLYWIDDRRQVIDEIRKLGITVIDVAGHQF